MKRYLTLEDLYNYYSSTALNAVFDADEANGAIVVQVPANVVFDGDNSKEQLLPVVLKACHTGENNNHFSVSDEVMTSALPSFLNRPILAYIHEVDGVPQFHRHDRHIEDGEIVYDEYPVGVIPESGNPHLEFDEDAKVNRVVVNGYLYENYSKASEILQREQKCSVSVEMYITKLHYDALSKLLVVDEFYFNGVTILGYDSDKTEVHPGMAGSDIQLADFSMQNNSHFDLVKNQTINENSLEKGGENMDDQKIVIQEFALSHDDIRGALYTLINADDDKYFSIVDVYDDHFVYHDWDSGKFYKRGYRHNETAIVLDDEVVEVFSEWLTTDEIQSLSNMKAEFAVAQDKLAKFEVQPAKTALFDKYDEILSNDEEFASLKEACFDISLEEIESKIDAMILKKAKSQMFEKKTDNAELKVKNHLLGGIDNKKTGRYGNLFK